MPDEIPLSDRVEDTDDFYGILEEAFEGLEEGLSKGEAAKRVHKAWQLPMRDAETVVAVAYKLLKSRV